MSFAINRALEWRRHHSSASRRLRARAAIVRDRRPVVIVPSILGTRIVDERGGVLWGNVARLYFGPPIATAQRAVAAGTLDGFTVVPRVFRYDVFGGLLRYIERVGGYRRDRDMFVLEYDWRESVRDGAARLADLVARVRAGGHRGDIDLVGISSGGLVIRHFLATSNEQIGRAIYIGTPQRGSFQAVSFLHDGVRMVPLGKQFSPSELAACKTCWDTLPHPDDPVFVDEAGAPVTKSIYDASVWHELRLGRAGRIDEHLARAHALHRALDAAPLHADSIVIGARHLPTLSRLTVIRGRVVLPACSPRAGDPLAPVLFEPGDSSLPLRSLEGLPGLARDRVRTVEIDEHRMLPADVAVHRLTLGALLETAS